MARTAALGAPFCVAASIATTNSGSHISCSTIIGRAGRAARRPPAFARYACLHTQTCRPRNALASAAVMEHCGPTSTVISRRFHRVTDRRQPCDMLLGDMLRKNADWIFSVG